MDCKSAVIMLGINAADMQHVPLQNNVQCLDQQVIMFRHQALTLNAKSTTASNITQKPYIVVF